MTSRIVVAVINHKGGSSKTTSAVYLAHAGHEAGHLVELIDADPQGSARRWNERAPDPFPFPVIGMAEPRQLVRFSDAVPADRNLIIIDTPPIEQKSGVVVAALRVASVVLVPVAPSPIEYERLGSLVELLDDVAGFRADGDAPPLAVMLTRTHPTAASTGVWRDQITADGLHVLAAHAGAIQRYSQAWGDNVTDATNSAYGDAFAELMKEAR